MLLAPMSRAGGRRSVNGGASPMSADTVIGVVSAVPAAPATCGMSENRRKSSPVGTVITRRFWSEAGTAASTRQRAPVGGTAPPAAIRYLEYIHYSCWLRSEKVIMTAGFGIALVIFFAGALTLGVAGGRFRWRAFRNKQAWGGGVAAQSIAGTVVTAIGALLIWMTYPFN